MKLYIETPNEKKVSSVTRKRRGKNRLQTLGDDLEREQSVKEEPSDDLASSEPGDIWSNLKKSRRTRKITNNQTNEVSTTVAKRPRRNIRLDKSDATLLYRAVVISKAFSRDAIDFDEIATFINDFDGKILKQKWGTLRRSFGGAGAVAKGVETFQNMVMQGIEDELIEERHLRDKNLSFFLDYWKAFDATTEFMVPDEMPLYSSYEQNLTVYDFSKSVVDSQTGGHWEKIEDISMRQKETVLSHSILKDAALSKLILEKYGEPLVREACNALLRDREISYVSVNSDNKFLVGDKFKNTLILKVLTPKFFHQASAFKASLCSISKVNKGLIISQGIMPGQIASLLELVSANSVQLIRIDRAFRFENYESRLIDKEQIACDIVVKCNYEVVDKIQVASKPVPYHGPCQPIWIQLDCLVNKQLWTKIVTTLLYYIVFKPGIADMQLYNKVQPVLSLRDYYDSMKWLIESQCIVKLDTTGYWPRIDGSTFWILKGRYARNVSTALMRVLTQWRFFSGFRFSLSHV
ncbi:CIC11C00000004459 [Sungouiella intermedia]|uniref:CIC11C00000004459 n=1 Tax=Sungouiella intermedia TaxID=45354 RepID=A0A1L0GR34_9ASCO|nr:CIC11C00000004459 [[Candida] intermedia]